MHRRLVSCRLVDHNTFRMEASDGEVWLHEVERDAHGQPVLAQLNRWLNLIEAPRGSQSIARRSAVHVEQGTQCPGRAAQ
jgi:hypothetical protein